MSHLIAIGEQARVEGTPRIDQRLLMEDSSFNHRITQRQRNPRRRDSEYALAFQRAIAFEDAIPMDMSLARREEHELHGHHERFVGEHSSVRNSTGVLASPLVDSVLMYTFGSVLGPKHGLGNNSMENVILQDNLGVCLWMDDL